MNKFKIITVIAFAAIAFQMISISPVIDIEGAEQTSGGEDFVIEDGVLEKYVGRGGDVVVLEGVTAIGRSAFEISSTYDSITSVTLPDTVTSIGDASFRGCKNLKSVKMSDTVTSIGYMAFWNCENLVEISSLDGITSIEPRAFELTPWLDKRSEEEPIVVVNGILIDGRSSKGDVVIPDTVTTIAGTAFEGNKEITSVSIPDTVKSVGVSAFYACSNLITVKMSNFVESMGEEAFKNCLKLKNVRLSNSLKKIEYASFENCKKLGNITIPDSVESISDVAFRNCESLKYVTVSSKVTGVGDYVFVNCNASLMIYGYQNSYIESYAKDEDINFKQLAMDATAKTVAVGKPLRLITNSMAKCTWKSSNNSVASVNYYGKITAKKKGKSTITATLYGKNYNCIVTVK